MEIEKQKQGTLMTTLAEQAKSDTVLKPFLSTLKRALPFYALSDVNLCLYYACVLF
jgi:hypothetical protein